MADIKEDAITETLNEESRKQYSEEELKFLDFMTKILFDKTLNECEAKNRNNCYLVYKVSN